MDTAIWIAAISALGVVLSAFIQWRSNQSTVRAAASREEAARAERNEQLADARAEVAREREHQSQMAAAADARALERKQWEERNALSKLWRPKRLAAHQSALRAIDAYQQAVESAAHHFHMSNLFGEHLDEKDFVLDEAAAAFEATKPDVDTFGSELASRSLQEVNRIFRQINTKVGIKTLIEVDKPVSKEELADLNDMKTNLGIAIVSYRRAVKTDIGTL